MPGRRYLWGLMLCIQIGCAHHQQAPEAIPTPPAPFQQYISQKFDWSTVKRVVLLPLANQSTYEHAAVELQSNLAAELQRAGYFDVVMIPRDDYTVTAQDVFTRGTFDEIELLRVAREHDAQAILFANITQYHPYAPPRVGLSLLMVCPGEGVAIASADGLWDAREQATAKQAFAYHQQVLSWKQGLLGIDRVLESPDVYQRFVCQQIASSLRPPDAAIPMPVIPGPAEPVMPAGASGAPSNRVIQAGSTLPPLKSRP